MDDPLKYQDALDYNTKGLPEVSHVVESFPAQGEKKVRICRCWQSNKFPYCDDTHKVLVQSGDNVGPYIAKLRAIERPKNVCSQTMSHVAKRPSRAVAGKYRE
eukprot:GHVQ01018853.1.p1 GENE.GHVQ01018853.1~~GHVQ01018853.1.p1  ORF type:complete len:103 (-),score=7.62 GHVQ01018853.1:1139-1447(-)